MTNQCPCVTIYTSQSANTYLEDYSMKKITLTVMDIEEAFMRYKGNKHLREEYKDIESFKNARIDDINSMMNFLNNDAEDIRMLTENETDLLGLDHGGLYYISTWNDEYVLVEEI